MRRRLAQLLDRLDLNLKLLEAYLIVKDPSAAKSAEAFDGLRLKVDSAYRQRRRHLAQLADLHRTAVITGDAAPLRSQIEEFLQMEGILVVDSWEPVNASLFEVVGETGETMRVTSPAYVAPDGDGGVDVIKRGGAERVVTASDSGDQSPGSEGAAKETSEAEEQGAGR